MTDTENDELEQSAADALEQEDAENLQAELRDKRRRRANATENIRKAYTLYRHDAITSAKKCVEEGGGIWAGIQEGTENISAAVMFHSPKTRTTLGLRLSEITAEAVAEKIRNSDATFDEEL